MRFLNEAVFLYAAGQGLDLAIVNPLDPRVAEALSAVALLTDAADAGAYAARWAGTEKRKGGSARKSKAAERDPLRAAIIEGRKEDATAAAAALLRRGLEPLKINNKSIVPALEEVGRRFGRREFYLPQVIRAAEATEAAFGVLARKLKPADRRSAGRVVLATVAGDIHDIGKNVVAAVLKSNGFDVYDLGKSVPASRVVEAARKHHADIVGLSALMTTTMPEMAKVTAALRTAGVKAKVLVGGAAVTAEYAHKIGAHYAPDAVAAARVAKQLRK